MREKHVEYKGKRLVKNYTLEEIKEMIDSLKTECRCEGHYPKEMRWKNELESICNLFMRCYIFRNCIVCNHIPSDE